jgi:aspartate/methionine/tyrosine aminotransferase
VGDDLTPSIADVYPRGIAVGSMSKAFSLAGLRLGWLCAPTDVLKAAEIHRDYNAISVGMIDDWMGALLMAINRRRDSQRAAGRSCARTWRSWIGG